MRAFVGVGGNVGEPRELAARFRSAARAIAKLGYVNSTTTSPLYRSRPVGPVVVQPWYVNAVVMVDVRADSTASALLADLLAIETAHGRDRQVEIAMGPRTLDLDLLLFAEQELRETTPRALVVPHPRLHERAFVLRPLIDVADAALVVPGLGLTLGQYMQTDAVAAQCSDLELLAAYEPS